MAQGTCYINDRCSKSDKLTRGLCLGHYKRLLKYGNPLGLPPAKPFDAKPGERWRSIPGYEGIYEVSDHGRVCSLSRSGTAGRLLAQFPTCEYGYLAVKLFRDNEGDTVCVHRLVGENFIGPLPAGKVTRHGPGGLLDNRAVNLSYGTHTDNMNDMVRDGTRRQGSMMHCAKLTEDEVVKIRSLVAAGELQRVAAAQFGITASLVSMIVNRKIWRHC